jgi:hypothetical protein
LSFLTKIERGSSRTEVGHDLDRGGARYQTRSWKEYFSIRSKLFAINFIFKPICSRIDLSFGLTDIELCFFRLNDGR